LTICSAMCLTVEAGIAKPMPGAAPRRAEAGVGDGRRRDSDDLAVQVDQGAAAVAGIDGRGDLHHVGEGCACTAVTALGDGPSHGGDDALGDAAGQAQRVAHGHDDLAYLHLGGVAERGGPETLRYPAESDDREVLLGVGEDEVRAERLLSGGQRDLEGPGIAHDMGVGDDVAPVVVDDSGAELLAGGELNDGRQDLPDDSLV
jgi:hypothetical protein